MKIQITLSNSEKERYVKLCKILNTEPEDNINKKWGSINNGNITVNENCFNDAVDLTIAMIPKINSLVNFVKTLMPVIKDAIKAFEQKWVLEPEIIEIPQQSQPSEKTTPTNNNNKDKDKKKILENSK